MTRRRTITLSTIMSRCVRVLSLAFLFVSGCSMAAPQSSHPHLSPGNLTTSSLVEVNQAIASRALQTSSSPADYRIGSQDLLHITLFNIAETDTGGVIPRVTEVGVSQQGEIALPMLGELKVAGLTPAALETELRRKYKKYFHNPQVGVLVKEYHSQRVSVIGSVRSPGVFSLSGPKTLIDLLAMASGVADNAGSQVHLYRQGPEGRQNYIVDLYALTNDTGALNLPVQDGDVINVPKAGMFFVDGAVRKPGSYPLDRTYTFTQALATAGGADNTEAKISEITIFRRRGPANTEALVVNMEAVLSGAATDPVIESNDVIFVPTSMPKFLVKRFLGAIGMGIGIPVF
jgi:polysaccharide export outer membrane protein